MSIKSIGRDFIPTMKEIEKRASQAKFISSSATTSDVIKVSGEMSKGASKVKEAPVSLANIYSSPFHVTNESAVEINKLNSLAADNVYFNNAMKTRADWEALNSKH